MAPIKKDGAGQLWVAHSGRYLPTTQCFSQRVSVWFISRLGPNCHSCVQSSTSLPQNANDFVGVKKQKQKQALRVLVQILGLISVKLWWLPESSVRSGDGNLATDEGRLFSRWNKTAAHAQTWRHKRAQGWSKRHGRYTSFRTAVRFHCWTFQRRFLVRSDKLVHLFTPHFPLWNGLPWIS